MAVPAEYDKVRRQLPPGFMNGVSSGLVGGDRVGVRALVRSCGWDFVFRGYPSKTVHGGKAPCPGWRQRNRAQDRKTDGFRRHSRADSHDQGTLGGLVVGTN